MRPDTPTPEWRETAEQAARLDLPCGYYLFQRQPDHLTCSLHMRDGLHIGNLRSEYAGDFAEAMNRAAADALAAHVAGQKADIASPDFLNVLERHAVECCAVGQAHTGHVLRQAASMLHAFLAHPLPAPDGRVTEATIREVWDDATNAVCQSMQEQRMCNCPDGDCLAAKIGPDAKDIARALSTPAPEPGEPSEAITPALIRWVSAFHDNLPRDYDLDQDDAEVMAEAYRLKLDAWKTAAAIYEGRADVLLLRAAAQAKGRT